MVVPTHGRCSVERNRVKRRLTELVRRELLAHLGSMDVLIRARREAYGATFDELRKDVQAIGQRLPARSAE
jgi:ribonuclease P protein component